MDSMRTTRRTFVSLAAAFVAAPSAFAQSFPERPVTMLVGFAAGGPTDIAMRKLGDTARKNLDQAVVIDNKPGAAGSLAASILAKRPADGYTLGAILIGAVINQHIRKVDYDTNEFTPILMFGTLPQGIVVKKDARWKTAREFLDFAKANPKAIRYSTAGIGTAQHFSMERLGAHLGIQWVHVPYKSGTEAVMAAVSGEVDASAQTAEWKPFVKDGRLTLLATFTESKMPDFPNVPTMRDLGYDIVAPSMMGIVGPKGVPQAIVQRIHDAYKPGLDDPGFQAVLATMGITPDYRSAADFGKFLKSANAFYADSAAKMGDIFKN
jgi:tripartite-type tricarboxylate transporter receptor subunit TctC